MSPLIIILALFALLWVVMIRPQRAKQQKQRQLLTSVAPGDEILTVGGIYGIVQELEDGEDGDDLIVEIAEGIHVRVARRAVATVVKPDDDEDDEIDDDEDDEIGDDQDGEIEDGAEVEGAVEKEPVPTEAPRIPAAPEHS